MFYHTCIYILYTYTSPYLHITLYTPYLPYIYLTMDEQICRGGSMPRVAHTATKTPSAYTMFQYCFFLYFLCTQSFTTLYIVDGDQYARGDGSIYDIDCTIYDHLYSKAGGIAHRRVLGGSSYQMSASIIEHAGRNFLWPISSARLRMSPSMIG